MRKAIPLMMAVLMAAACGGRTEEAAMGQGMMADSAAMDHEMDSPGAMGGGAMADEGGSETGGAMQDTMHDADGMGSMKADTSGMDGTM